MMPTRIEGHAENWLPALLNADGCDGLQITGQGTIEGGGKVFWDAYWAARKADPKVTNLAVHRPRNLFIRDSKNVVLSGVSFRGSGFWNVHLYRCQKVTAENLDIRTPLKAPSTDGIDVDSCQTVTIRGCYISVDDDNIAKKGSKGPEADKDSESPSVTDVHIDNCTFGIGNSAITLGSEATHVKGLLIENCKIVEPSNAAKNGRAWAFLTLKLRPDTPQHYEDIQVRNIDLKFAGDLLRIRSWTQFYDLKGLPAPAQVIENVTIQNVTGSAGNFGKVDPPANASVHGLTLKDIDLKTNYGKADLKKVDGLKIDNVKLNGHDL